MAKGKDLSLALIWGNRNFSLCRAEWGMLLNDLVTAHTWGLGVIGRPRSIHGSPFFGHNVLGKLVEIAHVAIVKK